MIARGYYEVTVFSNKSLEVEGHSQMLEDRVWKLAVSVK